MNPTALVLWAILAIIGYLVGDTTGALIGLLIGLGLSFLADIFS